jgi:hypothetical protein
MKFAITRWFCSLCHQHTTDQGAHASHLHLLSKTN